MMNKKLLLTSTLFLFSLAALAQSYTLSSPDGSLQLRIDVDADLSWSLLKNGTPLLGPSEIALVLDDGTVYGGNTRIRKVFRSSCDRIFDAPFHKRSSVRDHYNELELRARDFSLVFRAYDDGAAYRFVTRKAVRVSEEKAEFHFTEDFTAWVPYVRGKGSFEKQFFNSFENLYAHIPLSRWDPARLAFLPVTVDGPDGVKLCISESDLRNYPGMYLNNAEAGTTLKGVFAPYPKDIEQGGHNMLQGLVKSREPFIYRGEGAEALPWRVVIVSSEAKNLADNDLVYRLGKAPEGDFSWVQPGKVAWDWWNAWNIFGVDFKAGINNETYMYYIDFAAASGIEYVILDEGWAVNLKADLFQVVPELDLPMLSAYAESKGVRLVLWAGYWAFEKDMEAVCRHYADMGIAGWKIDFLDRDDQAMVAFCEKAAATAARYHQFIDFHGTSKPAGLTRTWPNVLNYEAVNGLEQLKWAKKDYDQVTYDVILPFTRLVAGPADYTQGAMRNATKKNFKAVYSEGMSQGTRCRQLAEYVVFDAPFTMLCDSPSNYLNEPECTAFITSIPTVWDETVCLDGEIGQYVVMARRSGDTWYIGALTNWEERDITVQLPRSGPAILFRDGVNADRAARDYSREECVVRDSLTVHLAPGGGFVLQL